MLEIRSLSVAYGDRLVLDNVSLSICAGEVLAVVGPNGAGKSTLVRAVSGVVKPVHGKVLVDDVDLNYLSDQQRARSLAVVPQARSLPGSYTVYQTVLLGRTPHLGWMGRTSQVDIDRVQAALQQTQLQSLAGRLVGELSGGEQQRVLLARALAQDSPVLLLDEPTTHLDLQYQAVLLGLVRKLAARRQMSVLMVMHDLNLTGIYADRVALLVEGEVQAAGKPQEVLTAENLTAAYRVPVHVAEHPDYGTPLILPDGVHPSLENR